jgi:hypothetical protein
MTIEELRLLRIVQGILVRNYVDTQKLDVEVIGRSVYIQGEFKLFEYHASQSKEDIKARETEVKRMLYLIEQEIRRYPDIDYLEFKLTNWERVGLGQWIPRTG